MPDLFDADHPARQEAIKFIEHVLEPLFDKGFEGELYYALEDALTLKFSEYIN